jgi:hypothetical protein
MTGLRYADVEYRDNELMDLTSLTQDEFADQERMQTYRLDGHQRTGRGYMSRDDSVGESVRKRAQGKQKLNGEPRWAGRRRASRIDGPD